jgi:threonine dehydratase
MLHLIERKKVVAEGAGAAPLAALLSGAVPVERDSTVILVISGGNIDSPLLERTIHHALVRRGRVLRCRVALDDRPGTLSRLLAVVAQEQGNILRISHETGLADLPVLSVQVLLEIETRDRGHIASIIAAMETAGYRPETT